MAYCWRIVTACYEIYGLGSGRSGSCTDLPKRSAGDASRYLNSSAPAGEPGAVEPHFPCSSSMAPTMKSDPRVFFCLRANSACLAANRNRNRWAGLRRLAIWVIPEACCPTGLGLVRSDAHDFTLLGNRARRCWCFEAWRSQISSTLASSRPCQNMIALPSISPPKLCCWMVAFGKLFAGRLSSMELTRRSNKRVKQGPNLG